MLDPTEVTEKLSAYIRKRFGVAEDDAGFCPTADLWAEGYVDSMGIVDLLTYITSEFNVTLPDEELLGENFANIENIAGLVCRQIGAN